jgi:hypothetical protein
MAGKKSGNTLKSTVERISGNVSSGFIMVSLYLQNVGLK